MDHSDWEPALRVLIRAYRDVFARHPRLAPLLVLQSITDPEVMGLYEDLALALESAGFRGRDVVAAISTIDSFALGAALDLAAPEVVWDPPAEGYPTLKCALGNAGPSEDRGGRVRFRAGRGHRRPAGETGRLEIDRRNSPPASPQTRHTPQRKECRHQQQPGIAQIDPAQPGGQRVLQPERRVEEAAKGYHGNKKC